MIETAVALVLAHLLADFVLQSDAMVAGKRRPGPFVGHIAVTALASWAALGFSPVPGLILTVALAHALTDAAKLAWVGRCRHLGRNPGFAAFATDQAAHLAAIAVIAAFWPGAWAAGLWTAPALVERLPFIARLPEAMALAAGLVAAVWAGSHAVRELMRQLKDMPDDPEADDSLPNGGQLIGRLERLMILMLLVAGQPEGIGLLIAAKSILRFNELAADSSDRRASEYVIIGTLASFAWAIGVGLAVQSALAALAP